MTKKDLSRQPTEYEISQYEQATRAFSWSFQSDVVTFLRSLHEKNIDLNWALKCIVTRQKITLFDRKERQRVRQEWLQKARKCPQCGRPMYLGKVNDNPTRMVGGGLKTQWICPSQPDVHSTLKEGNKWCGYVEYSKRTLDDWMVKLRIKATSIKQAVHPFLRSEEFDFVHEIEDEEK